MEQTDSHYDKNVLEFLTIGVHFCAVLEDAQNSTKQDFISKISKILPLMYVKAQLLPEYDADEMFERETFVDEETYNIIRNNISIIMGGHDDFLEVFVEDMKYSDKPILSTVSENLADIYQDVKNFVMNFKVAANDDIIFEAVAGCKEDFKFYWGQKLVNVMRPLHELMYNNDEDDTK